MEIVSSLPLYQIVTNKIIQQNDIQRITKPQNLSLISRHILKPKSLGIWIFSLLSLHYEVANKIINKNGIQRGHEFHDICLYEAGKVVASACNMSSSLRWRRIPHE